jgi:hypothetical protein
MVQHRTRQQIGGFFLTDPLQFDKKGAKLADIGELRASWPFRSGLVLDLVKPALRSC